MVYSIPFDVNCCFVFATSIFLLIKFNSWTKLAGRRPLHIICAREEGEFSCGIFEYL